MANNRPWKQSLEFRIEIKIFSQSKYLILCLFFILGVTFVFCFLFLVGAMKTATYSVLPALLIFFLNPFYSQFSQIYFKLLEELIIIR